MSQWDVGNWETGNWDAPAVTPVGPSKHNQTKKQHTMKLQSFYPSRISDQVVWHTQMADELTEASGSLSIAPAVITACISDNRALAYILGAYLAGARALGPAATAAVDQAKTGPEGTDPMELPVFTLPTLPAGTVMVKAGALARILAVVALIKLDSGYTEAIGQTLGIIGSEDATVQDRPKFTLTLEQGAGCQCVRSKFFKYNHMGVYIECRRGTEDFTFLAIDTESPYLDERPLLVAGVPEVREYRFRFWDKGTPNGPWTDVASVTVSP